MHTISIVIVFLFVAAVLGVVAYALFEMSPFGKHREHFRDRAGNRVGSGPRLD